MCGICGFYDTRPGITRHLDELIAMGAMIEHRGPDAHGSALDGGVGLHNRRLSILDLEGGDQPFYSEDGRVALVQNGEIFNYRELRSELQARGHAFRTDCDTEVLLHLYCEFGIDEMLPKLNGFFAFAVHDRSTGALYLARDRMGVKPLYYAETSRGLVFGSELKALLAEGSLDTALDPTALIDYFTLRYVPAPHTIYAGARKLPAGHYLAFDGRSLRVKQWWDLPEFGTRRDDPREMAEELWELVKDAVRLRLISDVPLGAFLSGGLDSSGVVTAMQQLEGDGVRAISVGFDGSNLSELAHAERVAQALGVQHVTDVLQPGAIDLVDDLSYFFDEPFADPSSIPTYLLSQRTRREVTVALSGDGGDECYAGYRRYKFDQWEHGVRRKLPGPLFQAAFRMAGSLYPKSDLLPRPLRAKTTLQNLGRDPLDAYLRSVSARSVEESRSLLHPDLRAAAGDYHPRDRFKSWYDNAPVSDALSRVQYLDFHTWLPDYILCKTDRATMAHSLEAREPLLDYRLVEFAASVPPEFKLRDGIGKWLLKEAFAAHLPPETLQRPKQGFTPPLREWVDGRLPQGIPAPPWMDADALKASIAAHRRGTRDHSELLYQTMVLSAFERRLATRFADGRPMPSV